MIQAFIDSLAERLAEAFIQALQPKLRALLDEEITRLQTQLVVLTKPISDKADVVQDTLDRVKTSASLGKWLR